MWAEKGWNYIWWVLTTILALKGTSQEKYPQDTTAQSKLKLHLSSISQAPASSPHHLCAISCWYPFCPQSGNKQDMPLPWAQVSKQKECTKGTQSSTDLIASLDLKEIANACDGLSGRALRKLPFLAHGMSTLRQPCTYQMFSSLLKSAIAQEIHDKTALWYAVSPCQWTPWSTMVAWWTTYKTNSWILFSAWSMIFLHWRTPVQGWKAYTSKIYSEESVHFFQLIRASLILKITLCGGFGTITQLKLFEGHKKRLLLMLFSQNYNRMVIWLG